MLTARQHARGMQAVRAAVREHDEVAGFQRDGGHGRGIDARRAADDHVIPTGNPTFDALATFARGVTGTSGTVAKPVVDAVKAAGYTDAQIVDTIFAITSITFTNLLNRINDTPIDFPKAPA